MFGRSDSSSASSRGKIGHARGVAEQQRTSTRKIDQVTKGEWWMPWRRKAMKDVVSCDKLR